MNSKNKNYLLCNNVAIKAEKLLDRLHSAQKAEFFSEVDQLIDAISAWRIGSKEPKVPIEEPACLN